MDASQQAGPEHPTLHPASPPEFVRRTYFGWRLTIVALICTSIVALLVAAYGLSLTMSNAVRAYVAGEGLWTRAQKDAVFALERYAGTRDPSDYALYERALSVTLGDRTARLEMEKEDYDASTAMRGLWLGGNEPADIPDMIFLFRYFRGVDYLDQAIAFWAEGDRQIDILRKHATQLRAAVEAKAPPPEVDAILEKIRQDNYAVAGAELRFSRTLAQGARWVHETLVGVGVALTVALLGGGLLLARRIAQALEQRLRFETVVARLSSRLSTLRPAELDQGIDAALGDIGRYSRVDRSYVFLFDETYSSVSCTYEWCADGIAPQITRLQKLRVPDFPWVMTQLQHGRIVHVPRVAALPLEAFAERSEWEAEAIKSLLLVPMQVAGSVRGYVGFDSVRKEKRWPKESQDLLRIFGEIVANTMRRVQSERTLRERNERLATTVIELERSNAELEEFAYAASHDLKTPLRAIHGFIQLLQRRYKDKLEGEGNEYIDLALKGVEQMNALIAGLLTMSRIGKGESQPVPTDCEAILNEVIGQTPSIAERHVEITHDPMPTVLATPLEIRQLFQNLIGNAIKFQPGDAPRVHVGVVREEERWKFWVKDWGIGIDPKHHQKIFQIFQRLHPSDAYEGSGIGLAICRKIVQRHGGRIWVESEVGKGTTFYFTLKA